MMSVRKRACIGAVVLAVIATAAGCNLSMAKAGASCPTVGKYAQDGTYVLKCNARHKWEKGITVAFADSALKVFVSSFATTTAPPSPALTSFGAGKFAVGPNGGRLAPGQYVSNDSGSAGCSWQRLSPTGAVLGGNSFYGLDFVDVSASDGFVQASGPCTWGRAVRQPSQMPPSGNATYRVGFEIYVGNHLDFAGGPNCYWEIDSALDGSDNSVVDSGHSSGPFQVPIADGDAALQLRGCGQPSINTNPYNTLLLVGDPNDPIIPDDNLFYDQYTATVAATVDPTGNTLTVTGGGWTIVMAAPTGQTLLSDGTLYSPVAQTHTSGIAGLSFGGHGRTCSSVGGDSRFVIKKLTVDGAGQVTKLSAQFLQNCNGLADAAFGDVELG